MSSPPPVRPLRKVVLLAPASVIHTQRWAQALAARGLQVVLATQHDAPAWPLPPGVRLARLPWSGTLGYFRNAPALRRLLAREQPDLLNAHYASGYGTTAALAGFRPWLLSVWGSDVYDFPYEGWGKGWLVRRNLRAADALASTSHDMAAQVRRLVPDRPAIAITSFGVETDRFVPAAIARDAAAPGAGGLVIGTVKTLAPKYGIDLLIRAFAALRSAQPQIDAHLVLVGGGPQGAELEALAASLGVAEWVRFVGPVPHAEVPRWLQSFDIYVAASRLDSESFGVAVLEASACGLPVIVSKVGGLPEVVVDGETGRIVPKEDVARLTAALTELALAPELRRRFGAAGRQRVLHLYDWRHSVNDMLACYQAVLDAAPRSPGRVATT